MLRNMRPAVAVMLALMCASASSYPLLWTGISTSDCSAVPASSYGPHPAPTADEQTVFTVKRLGSTVWKMCPGSTHKIQAKFPEQRQFLITASQGAFAGANSADACTNRIVSPGPMPMAEAELTLSCDATGIVKLNMISVATPGTKAYKQVTTTLPVNPLSACPASPCHAAAAQTNLESGSLSVQHTSDGVNVQLPAIPSPLASTEANPSAPAAAAPKPVNIDLSNLFKLPSLSAGSSSDASKPNPAQILAALQKLGGVAAQPTDAATAAAAAPSVGGSVTGGAHPLQALSQINATQAWVVVKQLGQLLNTQDENPANIKSVMDFVSQAGKILPGASSSESAAPDLPTAVLNVVKATGKLLPSDRPADLMTVLHFCRTVGDLLGKITAARVPPTGPAA